MVKDKKGRRGRNFGAIEFTTSKWVQCTRGWSDCLSAGEGVFVIPGKPTAWKREVPHFGGTRDDLDEEMERIIVETVMQNALKGDARALGLCFRANRGFARPVEPKADDKQAIPYPPEVAAAMFRAGFAALNISHEDIPDPQLGQTLMIAVNNADKLKPPPALAISGTGKRGKRS